MAQASISVVDTIVELPLPCGQSHCARLTSAGANRLEASVQGPWTS